MAVDTQDLRGREAPGHAIGGQRANLIETGAQGGGRHASGVLRLQIGLLGLAAMVLLVALANIIMTSAQQNQAEAVPEAAPTVSAREELPPVSDPLADMGVVPDLPAEAERAEEARAAQARPTNAPALP